MAGTSFEDDEAGEEHEEEVACGGKYAFTQQLSNEYKQICILGCSSTC